MGRQTKLTPALRKRIAGLLRDGNTLRASANLCGVGARTLHEWMERGQQAEPLYAQFFSAVSRARDSYKARLLRRIHAANDWRAVAFLLERRFPDEFGRVADRQLPSPEANQMPPTINVIVERNAESDEAVKLFGERPV